MIGNEVKLNAPPKRIISVVPSQTELLSDLGLEEEVIGITKFCVHPQEWFRTKTRVGGTKTLDIEKIKSLQPDLILANKEENTKEQIEELMKDFPVWVSDITTVADALEMITQVGALAGREMEAQHLVHQILSDFPQRNEPVGSVAYLIWYRPWMSIGKDTFIHDVLKRCGFRNVFGKETRYPEVSPEALQEVSPDMVLLSSEPFPFKEKHIAEIRTILPGADIRLVDGEMFSWYGSRLLKACTYLKAFLQDR